MRCLLLLPLALAAAPIAAQCQALPPSSCVLVGPGTPPGSGQPTYPLSVVVNIGSFTLFGFYYHGPRSTGFLMASPGACPSPVPVLLPPCGQPYPVLVHPAPVLVLPGSQGTAHGGVSDVNVPFPPSLIGSGVSVCLQAFGIAPDTCLTATPAYLLTF